MVSNRTLSRAGLLLALTLLFQSLRMIMPLPPFLSIFIIGTLVNTCLIIAARTVGIKLAAAIAVLAPIIAYFQQLLVLPVFIIPVAIGNVTYITLFKTGIKKGPLKALLAAALAKASILYLCFQYIMLIVEFPSPVAKGIMMIMSWPQFVTALLGGLVAIYVIRRLSLPNRE